MILLYNLNIGEGSAYPPWDGWMIWDFNGSKTCTPQEAEPAIRKNTTCGNSAILIAENSPILHRVNGNLTIHQELATSHYKEHGNAAV